MPPDDDRLAELQGRLFGFPDDRGDQGRLGRIEARMDGLERRLIEAIRQGPEAARSSIALEVLKYLLAIAAVVLAAWIGSHVGPPRPSSWPPCWR